jgi:ppGpp synthetase/RelA/SpoT-type nucleotidyltranferase
MTAKISQIHQETHNTVKEIIAPYHERLDELDTQIRKLNQERQTIKATMLHELSTHKVKLPKESIDTLAAACW